MPNNPITPTNEARTNGTVIDASHTNDLASALNRSVGFATQAAAASTLILTVASLATQEFTGTTPGQIVKMPVVSTLGVGMAWVISNKSTQSIAVNSSGDNLIFTVPADTDWIFTCKLITGTTAASWSNSYAGASAVPTSSFVGARTTISVAQSIPNAIQTVILFDTEQHDTNTIHSTASNTGRMTVPTGKGGYWGFKANVTFNGSNLTGRRILVLLKNGATVKLLESAVNQVAGAPTSILMLDTLLLIAGDYVEIAAYQSSGGALNLDSDAQNTGATSFVAEFMGA